MALNPDKIKLLFKKIYSSEHQTFSNINKQLFNYLNSEVKDNPVYDHYEKERARWENWPNDRKRMQKWELPDNLEDVKSLAYDLYKSVAEQNDNGDKLSFHLFRQTKFSDNIYQFNKTFIDYFEDVLDDILNANPEIETRQNIKTKGDLVFIIHGHDNELKSEIQLLMQNAGINNIVLHEQADKGRTIIDKLIDETNNSGYAIAILTPDDLTNDGSKRARQNVILEIGYFIGKIGKERIRFIVKGDIEIPSDLQGILYEKFDRNGAWKIKLLKEIQAVGIYVDIQNAISKF